MNILISGSTGLIGEALTQQLRSAGHQVTRLVRSEPSAADELRWDPSAVTLAPALFAGVDGVVHLAGENIASGRWTAAKKDAIASSRSQGTAWIARSMAACEKPPRVLVSASAIGFYGDRGDEALDEAARPGKGFLPDVCRAWEAAADPARAAGIRVVHPRIGVVLSPDGGALTRMLTPFKLGVGGPIGSGTNWFSWISLHDQVRVLEYALMTESLTGPVNSVAPGTVRFTEFASTLGRVLRRPTFLPTPAFAMRLALGQMADDLILASTRVVPTALTESGFTYDHPNLESALRSVLDRPARKLVTT